MAWLVTGAAGYIGSHLLRQRADWVALDNLASGRRDCVPEGTPFHTVDITDIAAVGAVFAAHNITGVVHLAALKRVADSVSNPGEYERVNVDGLQIVLNAMAAHGVRALVFASSAAVYGPLDQVAGASISETAELHPANPYGATKLTGERMVAEFAEATASSYVTLRSFNAAGTSAGPANAGGLVELAAAAALSGHALPVFGTDYPTADGTCVRDYVHIDDVVAAIMSAIAVTAAKPTNHLTVNVGSGHASSVLDVVQAMERASGRRVLLDRQGHRPGDIPVAVANVALARHELGWRASRSLDDIAESAWKALNTGV